MAPESEYLVLSGIATRAALCLLWTVAAVAKLLRPLAVKPVTSRLGFVAWVPAPALSVTLFVIEAGLAWHIAAGVAFATALAVAGGLLVVFSSALAYTHARGRDEGCGCWGASANKGAFWWWDLARNAVLFSAVATLLILHSYEPSIAIPLWQAPVLAVFLGLVLGCTAIIWSRLAERGLGSGQTLST